MPLQDLTPQLRTRLNRMERVVGWFVILAAVLMMFGFAFYIYNAAEQRGWFEIKAPFYTYSDSGAGLKVGDEVQLMGFPVGHITGIRAMPPRGKGSDHNVEIDFEVIGTNYNYLWTGNTRARFDDVAFLGARKLNLSKGTNGYNIYINFPVSEMTLDEIKHSPHLAKLRLGEEIYTNKAVSVKAWIALSTNMEKISSLPDARFWVIDATDRRKKITAVWNDTGYHYEPFEGTNIYCLLPDESPGLMDRVQGVVLQIEAALPNFLALTNQLAATLSNSVALTSNLNAVTAGVRPAVDNVAAITANLRNPQGSLGEWILPPNLREQLAATLLNANAAVTNANLTITNVNTNLLSVFDGVTRSLDGLAGITSNLNNQVQANSNMLTQISDIVVHSDEFIQGLKHHWLFRSAFKTPATNSPAGKSPPQNLVAPREQK